MGNFGPVIIANIPYSDLEKLSNSVKKCAGVYILKAPSGGPGTPAVDAHCWFPSLDDSIQFEREWAASHDD
ncbi:hypothetical protein SAMN02927900_04836 [Rhizobium mongolense subsp. loessense]|jgi:hypothetical protein|uniref:Uncharacterized protein n=3 Tax=Rhizobium mongolense TaxID=57676 RepID=A0A7W6RKK9_9HYPH|nr:hypothetical protein [Rhizobium mongolense]MBB4274196.1 hypothetical protein [Rhizobium mongolense]TVZ64214.1 hypothetical protein BCL32_4432 [Rhizobium mongolense USDA 1844]SCW77576.1 hypothetical protein SAMN02927900_04836 [Rhizobium mongolense subsp. loessense]